MIHLSSTQDTSAENEPVINTLRTTNSTFATIPLPHSTSAHSRMSLVSEGTFSMQVLWKLRTVKEGVITSVLEDLEIGRRRGESGRT